MRIHVALLAALGAATAAMSSAPRPSTVRLVRCAPRVDLPCLRTFIALSSTERLQLAIGDSASAATRWSGALAGAPLIGPGVAPDWPVGSHRNVLIVLDRSGSMAGEGEAFARIALKGFLGAVDTARTRVAIATFGGVTDTADIASAPMTTVAQGEARLDTLAAPLAHAGSSLETALRAVTARAVQSGADGSDALTVIVLTPGQPPPTRNNTTTPSRGRRQRPSRVVVSTVVPLDDSLPARISALSAAGARVWILQLGTDPAIPPIPAIDARLTTVLRVPLDPNALAAALARVGREFVPGRRLLFALSTGGRFSLGRSALAGAATFTPDSGVALSVPLLWRPPVFALPVYQGTASADMLTPAIREGLLPGASGDGNGTLIALVLACALAAAWILTPRVLWVRPLVAPVEGGARTMSTTRMTASAREAEPRKPEDITHQTARRTAMQR